MIINSYQHPICVRARYLGFTLIEVILVIIILGIVASITAPLIYQGAQSTVKMTKISKVGGQARIALDQMMRELQLTQAGTASVPSITTMGANNIVFKTVDGKTIQYTVSGSNLVRTVNSGTPVTLASGVTALTFTYQKSDGSVTAVSSEVRYVTVTMTVAEDTTTMTLTNTAFLRNRAL